MKKTAGEIQTQETHRCAGRTSKGRDQLDGVDAIPGRLNPGASELRWKDAARLHPRPSAASGIFTEGASWSPINYPTALADRWGSHLLGALGGYPTCPEEPWKSCRLQWGWWYLDHRPGKGQQAWKKVDARWLGEWAKWAAAARPRKITSSVVRRQKLFPTSLGDFAPACEVVEDGHWGMEKLGIDIHSPTSTLWHPYPAGLHPLARVRRCATNAIPPAKQSSSTDTREKRPRPHG